jgi:hypothetical protein
MCCHGRGGGGGGGWLKLDFETEVHRVPLRGFPSLAGLVRPEAGVSKKLSLAGLAKLSRRKYSRLRFGLASAGYPVLVVHDMPVYKQGEDPLPPSSTCSEDR